MREHHDLSWSWPGRVFEVLDRQDSGNLCLALRGRAGRVFVKYAGASTIRYEGNDGDAMCYRRARPKSIGRSRIRRCHSA
jgi:serine/threonine-protein kinase